jgi:GNAT superfamily N-acetyltransferase
MIEKSPELRNVSATLSADGLISLAGNRLTLRQATVSDKGFILSTWIRSYQVLSRKSRTICNQHQLTVADDIYLRHHPKVAEDHWPFANVLKDAENGPGTACVGYVVGGPGLLHYVYVVPELRNMGLAKIMIEKTCGKQLMVSHMWPYKMPALWQYNPYLGGFGAL